jgi:hypothetical protein
MKLTKTRYEFACGFCGAGGKKYVSVEDMHKAANHHSCRCSSIKRFEVRYFEGFAKPVSMELVEAK